MQCIMWEGAGEAAFLLHEAFWERRERKGQEFRLLRSSEEAT